MGNANRAKLAGCWMFLAAIAMPGTPVFAQGGGGRGGVRRHLRHVR